MDILGRLAGIVAHIAGDHINRPEEQRQQTQKTDLNCNRQRTIRL